jgi:hypothetical protein
MSGNRGATKKQRIVPLLISRYDRLPLGGVGALAHRTITPGD